MLKFKIKEWFVFQILLFIHEPKHLNDENHVFKDLSEAYETYNVVFYWNFTKNICLFFLSLIYCSKFMIITYVLVM